MDVRKALHCETSPFAYWAQYRKVFHYHSPPLDVTSLFPIFLEKAPHWNIEIVSGTADANCPMLGTLRWVHCLGRTKLQDTKDWHIDGIVAGKVTVYEGITLTTVKSCGHVIPTHCPKPGLEFFRNYLNRTVKKE